MQPQVREVYIGFDGSQVVVRTDVPQVADFLAQSHQWLIVPEVTTQVGELTALKSSKGIECRGAEYIDFAGPVEILFDWISHDILEQFMRARRQLSWLHAGVVYKEGRALILAGASGQGKSTLTTLLVESGWLFLSDEMAPVEPQSDIVIPYPRTPVRRLDPGSAVTDEARSALPRETYALSGVALHRLPAAIGAFVFPKFAYGTDAVLTSMGPGETALQLAANCVNFLDDSGASVARIADVARRVPGFALNYGNGIDGARVIDQSSFMIFAGFPR
jgi:hypothetical protein